MSSHDAPTAGQAHYLALGDSYTIGEGVPAGLRWPAQLVEAMRARGLSIAEPQYIARTGWTTDELSAAIDEQQTTGKLRAEYQLVSLQIGVNDQYRGLPPAEYIGRFDVLLARAIAFAGGHPEHVLVLSIPDWGSTPFARASGRDREHIATQLDQYNAIAAAACERMHVAWVDITAVTRDPATAGLLAEDGLHPSGDMYALWARRVEAGK